MGLITENYVSKSTGIALPKAYAVLKNLIIESDNSARAIFAIQASRENAETYNALDKVEVEFIWDRKSNPVRMAYAVAKKNEYCILYEWDDDIVIPEEIKEAMANAGVEGEEKVGFFRRLFGRKKQNEELTSGEDSNNITTEREAEAISQG